ncbi:hypothetical protein GCM10027062_25070 [Nocardioides hungaricus]
MVHVVQGAEVENRHLSDPLFEEILGGAGQLNSLWEAQGTRYAHNRGAVFPGKFDAEPTRCVGTS